MLKQGGKNRSTIRKALRREHGVKMAEHGRSESASRFAAREQTRHSGQAHASGYSSEGEGYSAQVFTHNNLSTAGG